MSVTLPSWVGHFAEEKGKRNCIYSLHVHPDGSRLATAGLDTKIRIWATEPILDPAVEKMGADADRLLSTLSRHSGPVLVVRWANSGRYLASGSDDMISLVWELDTSGRAGFGSLGSSDVNVEEWRPRKRLVGHESDVVDLAWSLDDTYLATVALDSLIYVWSGVTFDAVRRIDGHNGFVKGVVWDPLGQYLATASDDKTVKVWRTSDWGLQVTVQEPFESSPSSTFFRRPSWSPDGAHLLTSNAKNGPIFVASVIDRSDWSSSVSLVGHENAVMVAAFSPRAFQKLDSGEANGVETVLAIGGLDQSISIWITGRSNPILVAKDVFDRQVTDLSWGSDGHVLYASSGDGNIAVFSFPPGVLPHVATNEQLRQVQGRFVQASQGLARVPMQTLQAPTQMMSGLGNFPQLTQAPGAAPFTRPAPPPPVVAGTADRPNVLQPRKAGEPRRVALTSTTTAPAGPTTQPNGRLDQQITVNRDGKRRIRPTLLDGGSGGGELQGAPSVLQNQQQQQASAPMTEGGMTLLGGGNAGPRAAINGQSAMQQAMHGVNALPSNPNGLPSAVSTSGAGALISSGAARGFLTGSHVQNSLKRVAGDELQVARRLGMTGADYGPTVGGSGQRDGPGNPVQVDLNYPPDLLPAPIIVAVLRADGPAGQSLEARNWPSLSRPSEVALIQNVAVAGNPTARTEKVLWLDFTPSDVIGVSCSLENSAAAFRDGVVVVYSRAGRRLWTLHLEQPAHHLSCTRDVLLVLLPSGDLFRFAISDGSELHPPISLRPMIQYRENLSSFWVHSNGVPIILLHSETAYALQPRGNGMVCISSGWWADCSRFWNWQAPPVMDRLARPVYAVEVALTALMLARSTDIRPILRPPTAAGASATDFETSTSLRHLETRLIAAELLESPDEYREYLGLYAQAIAEAGILNLAEELVLSLLGTVYASDSTAPQGAVAQTGAMSAKREWQPTILGLRKRELLIPVLEVLQHSRGQEIRAAVVGWMDLLSMLLVA